MPGTQFFSWPGPFVKEFLGSRTLNLVFIPYAAVTLSLDEYASIAQAAFKNLGYALTAVHTIEDQRQAVEGSDGIVVGGGNTFVLLDRLYKHGLVKLIREKALSGTPYIGWSAGANVACPTLMTTNDMPIVYPPSFEAFNLVPFQINPHYSEFKQPGHGGETRQQRIEEFLAMNPRRKVIGLPEGTLLHRDHDNLTLKGTGEAKLFQLNSEVQVLYPAQDLSYLLAADQHDA